MITCTPWHYLDMMNMAQSAVSTQVFCFFFFFFRILLVGKSTSWHRFGNTDTLVQHVWDPQQELEVLMGELSAAHWYWRSLHTSLLLFLLELEVSSRIAVNFINRQKGWHFMIILSTSNEQCLETTTTANIIEVNTYTTDTSLDTILQPKLCLLCGTEAGLLTTWAEVV